MCWSEDAKTGEDLTRSILLQIILEEEAAGIPMFSEAALANIILAFMATPCRGHMGSYIEKNLQMFTDFQTKLAEQTGNTDAWAKMMQMPQATCCRPVTLNKYKKCRSKCANKPSK